MWRMACTPTRPSPVVGEDVVRECHRLGFVAFAEGRPRLASADPALLAYLAQAGITTRRESADAMKVWRGGWGAARANAEFTAKAGWSRDGHVITPDGPVIETTGKVVT
jgi:hypothetical protein